MDIFEEIKEAVLASTPGEDTRNFYRNQGVQLERDRIINAIEQITDTCDSSYLAGLYKALTLIKGDNNA